MYIQSIRIRPEKFPSGKVYPFKLKVFQNDRQIILDKSVTFFAGENGTGKSTLLKSIARKCGIHIWETTERSGFEFNPYDEEMYRYIEIERTSEKIIGSFFGAEIFRHFAELLDEWAKTDPSILAYFGGTSLTVQSHGQCNMSFFENRFKLKGLYLLDEPESALSPQSQIKLMNIIRRASQRGDAQFIIASHSPILMALDHATIHLFEQSSIRQVNYEETDYYKIYKDFMNDRKKYIERNNNNL